MIAIIGLGNPGREYNWTRHNIGFEVIGKLAYDNNINMNKEKYKAIVGEGRIGTEKVLLIQPLTYMNLSGESVRAVMDFYKLDPTKDIIVIADDISLPTGKIRIRAKGSAGGHNGLKSIIAHAGTDQFTRIKVGVGANQGDLVKHVLGKFSKGEREIVDDAVRNAASASEVIVMYDVQTAMNKFN